MFNVKLPLIPLGDIVKLDTDMQQPCNLLNTMHTNEVILIQRTIESPSWSL